MTANTKSANNSIFEQSFSNFVTWVTIIGATFWVLIVSLLLSLHWFVHAGDLAVYHSYSQAIWGGAIPYRNLALEYPPGVLPFILMAKPLGLLLGGYIVGFLVLTVLATALVMRHAYQRRGLKETAVIGLFLVPLAQFLFFELDIFAAVALYGSIILFTQKRLRLAAVLLAVSVLIKGYPIVCLPVFLLGLPRDKLKNYLLSFTVAIMAGILPFILLSPGGMWRSVTYHLGRPIQIESGAAAIGFVLKLFGQPVKDFLANKSVALQFPGSHVLGLADTLMLIGGLAWLAYWLLKSKARKNVALECFAALLIFVIFFKVGSPQYLVPVCLVGVLASDKLSSRERFLLSLRFLAIGIVVFMTFSYYRQLVMLQSLAGALIIIRYVLLAELLIWSIKQLRLGRT